MSRNDEDNQARYDFIQGTEGYDSTQHGGSGTSFYIDQSGTVWLNRDFSSAGPIQIITMAQHAELQAKYDMLLEEMKELKRRLS